MTVVGFAIHSFAQNLKSASEFFGCNELVVVHRSEVRAVATVILVRGSLERWGTSAEYWEPVSKGHHLYNGDVLRACEGAKAIIVYTSGQRALLNEHNEIRITDKSPTEMRRRIKIENPSSVASILG